ncbi:MAG TPA: hypothetical protein VFP40_07990, partial [Terriglobales bacterium]|nr:hypothetical protein [Terriglobales bacterium]
ILSLAVFLGLSGCGGNNKSSTTTSNNNPTPGATNTGGTGGTTTGGTSGGSGGTGSGGTGSGGTGGGTAGGGTTASTDITGTIVDSQTGKAIAGTVVVDLESPAPGDYVTVAETTADASGNFTFKNVAANKAYAVAISAASGNNYYMPAVVVGGMAGPSSTGTIIGPGTNLGKIALTLPTGVTTATVGQPVTSQNAAGQPTPITVVFVMRQLILDFEFTIPLPQQPPASVTTGSDPSCSTGTDCAAAQLTIPASPAVYAVYDPNGLKFSSQTGYFTNIQGSAFVPNSTTPDCSPQQNASSFAGIIAGQKLTGSSLDFKGCQ